MRSHIRLAALSVALLSTASVASYANTLTGLIPDLYAGLDVVSRELVGFIPSVRRDSRVERAAVGQPVKYHIAPPATGVDIEPAMTVPEPANQTIGYGSITITKSRAFPFGFVGEEERGLNNGGPGAISVQADMFAQALRALVNEIELDVATEAAANASRATGTVGSPFSTNLADSAQLRKILDDNGAPLSGRSLVGSTSMGAALRTLGNLTKVNEAGTTMTLRDGEILPLHGFSVKESGQARSVTKGTASAAASTNNAGYAVGSTTITLAAAGTGTFVAGDVVSFAGDANKYVVVTGDADISGGGTIVIAKPGLRQAIPASATLITTTASYTANVGFSSNALVLAVRNPALPQGGDAAIDSMTLTDERSGLTFEVRVYGGYRKIRYEVAAAWGVKAVKPEHIALLVS